MIEDFPQSQEPAHRIVGREVLALAGSALLYPFGLIRSRRRTPRLAEQRTVVLVHGYLGNKSSLMPLQAWLRVHGVKHALSYEYPSAPGIEQAAIGLKRFLRERVR